MKLQMGHAKLVLLDIFSCSCMNCRRSLKHINRLNNKYGKYGLFTAIVHPPEWEFEKSNENVCNAAKKYGIKLPIITDKSRKITKRLGINFWPSQILLKDGKIKYRHIGEGNCRGLERAIIKELNFKDRNKIMLFENEPEYSKFPNVYLGRKKRGKIKYNENKGERIKFGTVYADGNWKQKEEFLENKNKSSLSFLAKGNKSYTVAESKSRSGAVIAITADGKFLKKMKVESPDLYCIAEFKDAKERVLTLESKFNIAVYSFSFD